MRSFNICCKMVLLPTSLSHPAQLTTSGLSPNLASIYLRYVWISQLSTYCPLSCWIICALREAFYWKPGFAIKKQVVLSRLDRFCLEIASARTNSLSLQFICSICRCSWDFKEGKIISRPFVCSISALLSLFKSAQAHSYILWFFEKNLLIQW